MKIKFVLLAAGLSLIILFSIIQRYIIALDYQAYDVIELNDTYKKIVQELKYESIEKVEEKYSCKIILKDMDFYQRELYTALRDGDVVMDYLEGDILLGKIIFPSSSDSLSELKRNLSITLWILLVSILVILFTFLLVIYVRILKPFQALQRFANQISVGNLDIPLTMDQGNYFGAFTESFDMMRSELKKARQGEYEANISKKELVAGLSHDIKTPVSTIKALCEILEIKLQDEDSLKKVKTINQKADVIDELISNMFHATLEELVALRIEPREELSTIIPPMFEDVNHYGRITLVNALPQCLIYCDRLRLNQVIDNMINNSYKYANTNIDVSFEEEKEYITIKIRDYGTNISEEELPLLFEKFYRGENATAHSGAGLGLYLAKQFMEGMHGGIECYVEQGFVVLLTIKKV